MKKLICLLLAIPLLFISCSKENTECEESVQVNFYAKVPQGLGTRSSSGLTVNTVYCAVYENDSELKALRTKISIVDGQDIIFSPRLIKSRTYKVVFWACKEGAYDINSMENITRIAPDASNGFTEEDYDAFTFATDNFTVVDKPIYQNVTLTRPFAQLNLGITESEWNLVQNTFGQKPAKIDILIDDAKKAYDAFNQIPVGENITTEVEYKLKCSGDLFSCTVAGTDKQFKSIGMCYVLLGSTTIPQVTYTVYDENSKKIVESININNVKMEKNYRTNVVGNLLTGTVNYTISLQSALETHPDYNTEI